MNATANCTNCGSPLPRVTAGGLCARCLVGRIFGDDEDHARESPEEGLRLGNFLVGEKIGEGGSGIVYRASQTAPVKREAAIKVLKADSDRAIARFEAESQALATLDHPNVARFYDAGTTEEGQAFVAMELVEGRSLDVYCSEEALPIEQRVRILGVVAQAVQSGHARGIVHRDLKPSNILVDSARNPKVIDFGIARASESLLTETTLLTRSDELLGTPDYLSPEQATGSVEVDARSDVHALGAMLYEMLSGTPPLNLAGRRIGLAQALDEIRHREAAPPPGPAELGLIAMKALAKERSRRYGNAGEFADDLTRYLIGEPIHARAASTAYRLRKLLRRNKLASAAIALSAVALVTASIVSTLMAIKAKRASAETSQAFAQSDFQRATELMLANDQDHTVAFLCRGLRENPRDKIALRQLMLLLTQTDFPQPIGQLPIGNGRGLSIALSEDGSTGVVEEAGSKVTFFDVRDPSRPRRSVILPASAYVLATIPGHRKVAVSATGTGLFVLDYTTGECIEGSYPNKKTFSIGVPSRDGQFIALAASRELHFVDWQRNEAIWKTTLPATINSIDVSPDGTLVAAIGEDGILYLRQAADGKPAIPALPLGSPGTVVRFTPDGEQCVAAIRAGRAGREGAVHLLSLAQLRSHSRLLGEPRGNSSPARILPIGGDPWTVDFLCGGSHMLVVPGHGYNAHLWDLENGRMVSRNPASHAAVFGTGVALPDGSRVFTADRQGVVRQWDGESNLRVAAPIRTGSFCDSLHATPDSKNLVVHDINGHVQIWDTRHRSVPVRYFARRGNVHVAGLNPTGESLATVSGDGFFRVWDVDSNEPLLEFSTGHLEAVADFDWNSRTLAIGLPNGEIRAFRLGIRNEITPCGTWKIRGRVWLTRVSRSGHVAAGSDEGEVGVFRPSSDTRDASESDRREVGSWVTAASWGPGETLAVGTSAGVVALWREGKFVSMLENPLAEESTASSKIHDFSFSPAGNHFAAVRRDGGVLVWNTADAALLRDDLHHAGQASDVFQSRQRLIFASEEDLVSSTCFDNLPISWNIHTGQRRWEGRPELYVERKIGFNTATNELVGFGRLWLCDAPSGRLIASDLDLNFRDGEKAQGISFSEDGRLMAVPGNWGATRLYTFPEPPESIAEEWFLDFAEHWVGARVRADGKVRLIPIPERLAGRTKRIPEMAASQQAEIAEWLRAPIEDRAVAPGSPLSMSEALDSLATQTDAKAARSALFYRPGNPQAMLTLAAELQRSYPYPAIPKMAEFYAREARRTGDGRVRSLATDLLNSSHTR